MKRKFLKPGTLPDGTVMVIPIPGKGRDVPAAGEELAVTPYVERRIAANELIEVTKEAAT